MRAAEAMLIGFDVRQDCPDVPAWDEERRQRFLLRQDVDKPLSIDASVWPSAFDMQERVERPQWTGYVQDLWEDLGSLASAAADLGMALRYAAFEVLEPDVAVPSELSWRERVLSVNPASLQHLNAEFVGYDVADYYLLSGLVNCAFTEEERQAAARWLPHLNHRHLFASHEPALAFKREADNRVPEHAPFFVFGLWLLPKAWRPVTS